MTKNKINSNVNNPELWGPHAWYFLDSVILTYPNNPTDIEKNNYKNFFISLKNILPCISCRNNYEDNLVKYPITNEVLKTRNNMINWILNIHNEIRQEHKKSKFTRDDYLNYYNGTNKEYLLGLIIICIILLYFILNKIKS